MEAPVVTLSWNEHSNTLATEYKNYLDSGFLADCTLTAEGQSLHAHRSILSACSPYFHMLFSGEIDNNPIVFLQEVSFEMLKALVYFVYHGETEVPDGHWEAFLALSEFLEIKGVNDSLMNRRQFVSLDGGRDGHECAPNDNLDLNCFVPSSHGSNLNSSEDFSDQSGAYPEAMHSKPSVLNEGSQVYFVDVRSAMTLTQEVPVSSFWPSEISFDRGTTVEEDPLAPEISETKNEPGDDNESEPMQDVPEEKTCVMGEGLLLAVGEENVDWISRSSNSSVGEEPITAVLPDIQQEHQQLPRLPQKVSSGGELALKREPLDLEISIDGEGDVNQEQNKELMSDGQDDDDHNADRGNVNRQRRRPRATEAGEESQRSSGRRVAEAAGTAPAEAEESQRSSGRRVTEAAGTAPAEVAPFASAGSPSARPTLLARRGLHGRRQHALRALRTAQTQPPPAPAPVTSPLDARAAPAPAAPLHQSVFRVRVHSPYGDGVAMPLWRPNDARTPTVELRALGERLGHPPLMGAECPICYTERPIITVTTRCHHVFCVNYLLQWMGLNVTCPLCRERLVPRDVHAPPSPPTLTPLVAYERLQGSSGSDSDTGSESLLQLM